MAEEINRTTIDSVALWAEFDTTPAFDPDEFQDRLSAIGMDKEVVERLRKRGMLAIAILPTGKVSIRFIPDSPADRFNSENTGDPDVPEEERKTRWLRFYHQARNEADDDRFRAQWPELHAPE